MLKSYFKITFRNLSNNKLYSFINIAGLAIGMAACILILLWVTDELSYDHFNKNLDKIFVIPQTQHYQTIGDFTVMPTPAPLAPALKQDYPEIEYISRYEGYLGTRKIAYKDKIFNQQVNFADPDFFKIFSFNFIEGDEENALKDKSSIIITKEMAEKYFGNEDPVGKILRMDDKYDLKVSAVVAYVPHNSSIQFDMLVSISLMKDYGYNLENWGSNMLWTIVTLRNPSQYKDISKKIMERIKKEVNSPTAGKLFLYPYKDLHLYSISGKGGRIETVVIFSIIAFFILIIACINFMNLATARSAKRATEVGIRKVIGATRVQVAKQFFGESILLTLISLAIAIFLVELLLPYFNQLSGKTLTFGQISLSTFLLILLITILTGFISGVYPAIFLSSFKPVQILKSNVGGNKSKFSLRTILVVVQFAISIILIVGTSVVYLQMRYIMDKNIGLNKNNIIYFTMSMGLQDNIGALKVELLRNPKIKAATVTSSLPIFVYNNGGGWSWEGKDPKQEELVSNLATDYDFLKTYHIELSDGRYFSKKYATDDSMAIVINQSFADLIGFKEPVGKILKYGNSSLNIIGVVKDFNFVKLDRKIGPLVIYIGKGSYFSAKIDNADISNTLNFIKNTCNNFDHKFVFDYQFLDKTFEEQYKSEQRLGSIFNSFAMLAIIISCLGLLGLSSYMAELKTKEIGIRKVLGATSPQIIKFISKEFLFLVLLSNIIAWPVAYYFMKKWLDDFAYRIEFPFWVLLVSAILAVLIALITVSSQALKAASADPVKSLRYE